MLKKMNKYNLAITDFVFSCLAFVEKGGHENNMRHFIKAPIWPPIGHFKLKIDDTVTLTLWPPLSVSLILMDADGPMEEQKQWEVW